MSHGVRDFIEPDARCIACDLAVKRVLKQRQQRLVECTVNADGEWGFVDGHLRELPSGKAVAPGVMRFRDHEKHCGASLRPDPSTVPTVPTRPHRIRR